MDKYFDAHIHLWEYCLFNFATRLDGAKSLDEIAILLEDGAINGWMIGVRFTQESVKEKIIPDKYWLDKRFGPKPVIIVRTCLHLVIMNSAAMKVMRRHSPNGIFLEADVFSILNYVVENFALEPAQVLKTGLENLQRLGIAHVIDMAMDKHKLSILGNISRMDYYTTDFDLLPESLGYKVFLDGSLGARTAALNEAYHDDPDNFGQLNLTDQQAIDLISRAHQAGKPVAVHAIGDRAVDQFIRMITKTRHPLDRMEHAQVTRLDQLDTLAKMDIPICIQPIFSSELSWARERLGPKRIETAYAWQEMISRGIRLLAGSDAPVDEADPHIAAETASEPTGAHHLDYQQCLQLFSRNNWEFYGISPV